HLDGPRVADAPMEETHPLQHGTKEPEFVLEAAVDHFEAGVPMGKISVEPEIGKPLDELHGSPHVLEDCGPVSFDVKRHAVPGGRGEHRFYQESRVFVVLQAPAHMQSRALQSLSCESCGEFVCILRFVDSAGSNFPQVQARTCS